jgi:hypothetical protein
MWFQEAFVVVFALSLDMASCLQLPETLLTVRTSKVQSAADSSVFTIDQIVHVF